MAQTILRSTRHKPKPHGDGYDRRTLQLEELVRSANIEIADVEGDSKSRIQQCLHGLLFMARHGFEILPLYHFLHSKDLLHSYRALRVCGEEVEKHTKAIGRHAGAKVLLWEATEKQVVAHLAKKSGFKLLATPHNLESLVVSLGGVGTLKSISKRLQNEIKHLARADAVFCISREEQWLLNLFGVRADYLPYYPPQHIVSELLEVRAARSRSEQKRFLILGTAWNPPTFLGMVKQIESLREIRQEAEFEVDIAGFGTEKLKPYCDHPGFFLHGSVEPQQLNGLLTNARALLIFQQAGVGALTRIPEMLIAGIPVIANGNACRSAHDYPGLYPYESNRELTKLISTNFETPSLLSRPVEAETIFLNRLKQLVQS